MSDSIVGSDVDEQDSPSSPSSPHSFPEPVADEMSSLEESPMTFHRNHRHHPPMIEIDEEEASNLAMVDPTLQADDSTTSLTSFEQPDFPHTPLDVIEGEASNAEEMEVQQYPSTDCQRPQSEDEDVDIFSLQQNMATPDSLSTDETDTYLDAAAAAAEQEMEGPLDASAATTTTTSTTTTTTIITTTATTTITTTTTTTITTTLTTTPYAMMKSNPMTAILRKQTLGSTTVNLALKIVFTVVMILYYIGFIFKSWGTIEVFIPHVRTGGGDDNDNDSTRHHDGLALTNGSFSN
jgi:hypothetical protein